jgi:hypothetical protein
MFPSLYPVFRTENIFDENIVILLLRHNAEINRNMLLVRFFDTCYSQKHNNLFYRPYF